MFGRNLVNRLDAKFGEVDVVGGFHSSSKHSWIGSNIAEMVVVSKLAIITLNFSRGITQLFKTGLDISFSCFGNNSDLVNVVNPNYESTLDHHSSSIVAKKFESSCCVARVITT